MMMGQKGKRIITGLLALALAAAIWIPCIHLLFKQNVNKFFSEGEISPKAQALVARQLGIWSDPVLAEKEISRMRQSNAEWDFMARTYFVLSLANMGFRNPADKQKYLEVMDQIIDITIQQEKEHGIYYFLMEYAKTGAWVAPQKRSLFEDGEIALMVAARRLLEEKQEYKPLLTERVDLMVEYMRESPVMCGESYPDECWMFCNTVALAAIRIADILDKTDHSEFIDKWLEIAKEKLVDKKTGILISSFTFNGQPMDGPEGSSIWMVSHCLQVVDSDFAEDQYRRARKELAKNVFGFGYAKEWPDSWRGPADIDSGPIIPVLDISAGSSGCAFIAASAFKDQTFLSSLLTSLSYGGFPVEKKGSLTYYASNPVGDAVLLYSMVLGPVWEEVGKRLRDEFNPSPGPPGDGPTSPKGRGMGVPSPRGEG